MYVVQKNRSPYCKNAFVLLYNDVVGHNWFHFSTLNVSILLQESFLHYTFVFSSFNQSIFRLCVVIMYNGKKFLSCLSHYSYQGEKCLFIYKYSFMT